MPGYFGQKHSKSIESILVLAVIGAADVFRNTDFRSLLPRVRAMDVLYAEDTTPQQKVSALKTMLSSVGQVLILLSVVAMVCQIGSVVVSAVEMVLWPVLVPIKVLRWLGGGG